MPLSQLDKHSALILIDLQQGIVALPTVHPASDIVNRANSLTHAFRARHLPVVLVTVAGAPPGRTEQKIPPMTFTPEWSTLTLELEQQASDFRITKRQWGAFHQTGLHDWLQQQGVTQIVLAGISTSKGVESTARNAHEHGYNVALVIDAMTDRNIEAHRNSIERIFPALGETTTTDDLLHLLAERKD